MVCPECHAVEVLSRPIITAMKQRQPVPCTKCGQGEMRFKVGRRARLWAGFWGGFWGGFVGFDGIPR
jgi:ssDNA-binding Zn-finger/Zn-ribbon topoisomerase 1